MAHDEMPTNPTSNRPFDDVLSARIDRRAVLAGGVALAATTILAGGAADAAVAGAAEVGQSATRRGNLIRFEPVGLNNTDRPTVSPDYEWSVLAPWGTPLKPDAPEFSFPATSASAQENQVGVGHDGMWFFPLGRGALRNSRGILCVNHEFGTNEHLFGMGNNVPESLEQVRISQAAHGVSVIEIRRNSDKTWRVVAGDNSRRITPNTPVEFSGPVAGTELLENPAGNETLGTLNNCANGYTPWGTYLTCEENFNGYFGTPDGEYAPNEAQERYGFNGFGFGYFWHNFDPRFDLSNPDYANEQNRFGWVVEIDPHNDTKPVKRTALGRFKHEGVALRIGGYGRAIAYMGDDQRFDYIYKYVSSDNAQSMLRKGKSPLDDGKLYAARFDEDGTGEWLELTIENPAIAEKFSSQAEVLTFARQAADILGATPMDRPEWTTVAANGDVYCTLTNNTRRTEDQVDAANPQGPNPDGHIIRWRDSGLGTGTTFKWDIFLLASDTQGTDSAFGSPDGLWADRDGRLFIQTDGGQPNAEERSQNDQMLVADPRTGEIARLFTGVAGCEVTGMAITPNRKTMFINIQHPGGNSGDPALTLFPDYEDGVVPRDATIVLTRKDGGRIGS